MSGSTSPSGCAEQIPDNFGGAVDLLQIDPDRAEEANDVGAERSAAGIDEAGAPQTELVAQRAINQHLADRAQQPQAERHRPALGVAQLNALGDAAEEIEDMALQWGGVGRPDRDLGQRVLPVARRRQGDGRAQLAQVALQGLGLFREVDRKADPHMERQREHRIADPGHRQIRQMLVARPDAFGRRKPFGHAQEIGVAQHHPFGPRGGARGVGEQRQIVGLALGDGGLDIARMGRAELAPGRLHRLEGLEDRVVVIAQAARVVIDDQLQVRQAVLQRQDLVDLFLVLGNDDRGLGVIEHIGELGRDRVLVDRDGDAAEALRGELRDIEARAVLPDDRQLVAAPEALGGEPLREIAHLLPIAPPAVSLPDAAVLLAQGRAVGCPLGIAPQQLRQGDVVAHAAFTLCSAAAPR